MQPECNTSGGRQAVALAYAERGISIFPCAPGGKRPLTDNGFYDATTDRAQIRQWWKRWPDANIAAPTGAAMAEGRFILDVDAAEGGFESLAALEAEHGHLPDTTIIRTGRGGRHYHFQLPEGRQIRNGAGDFAPGLDIRGDGGYVLLPGSVTEGRYTCERKAPTIAAAPEWLLELAEKKHRRREGSSDRGGAPSARAAMSETMVKGGRNDGLTRIGGGLRARGAELEDLERELLRVNREQCTPPLPEAEVLAVAASVARYPKGEPLGERSPKIAEDLAEIERQLWARPCPKMGGKSERDTMVALLKEGRQRGRAVQDGVETRPGLRRLALLAATSVKTLRKVLDRLKEQGRIRIDNENRGREQAARIVLLTPRAKGTHLTIPGSNNETGGGGGLHLRAPLSAPRLRWSSPGGKPKRGTVRGTSKVREFKPPDRRPAVLRLGKTCGAVIDVLEARAGRLTITEIADVLQIKRPRDLRRRVIPRLEERGIVTVADDVVELVEDWLGALERERRDSGELRREELDREDYARAREAWRSRNVRPADEEPSEEQMDAQRPAQLGRRHVRELARVRAFCEPMNAPRSGPGLALRTYLERPTEERLEWLVRSLMRYHGKEPYWWKDYAPLVRTALDGEEVVRRAAV